MNVSEKDISRFWLYVEVSEGCWDWTGNRQRSGYGVFWLDGKPRKAHRVSWVMHNGPIPEHESYHGFCICHTCDNRSCVRPEHLFIGTNADNVADRDAKGRTFKDQNRKNQGVGNGFAKLTDADVYSIRNHPGTLREIAEIYGVSHSRIGAIKLGQSWTHLPTKEILK